MPSRINLTYRDFDREASTFSILGAEWTEVNFAAITAQIDALRTAVAAITRGSLTKELRIVDDTDYPFALPSNEAQREAKWLVGYTDTVTGKKYTCELPCANLTYLDTNHPKEADYADADVAAFVAAFENFARSQDGNTVDINYIRHVGRNN